MDRPKLRKLERIRLHREGEGELVVVRDPLELCEPIAVDAIFAPVLDALDGTRTLAQIRQSLMFRSLEVDGVSLADFVTELHQAGLLDDDRFRMMWEDAHDAFAAESVRPARRTGLLYPADPDELLAWIAPILPTSSTSSKTSPPGECDPLVAVVAPHQPLDTLTSMLRALLAGLGAPESYSRVLILATDHSPGLLPYASTDKDWDTPLGPVSVDRELLAEIERRVPWLLREQLRLRLADPIEWVCLLLRALWGDRCPPILPLACSQTRLTTSEGQAAAQDLIGTLELLLGPELESGTTLVWTAAELSHVGPAFGQTQAPPSVAELLEIDRRSIDALLDNRPDLLAKRCMDRAPSSRPSGAAALVTLVELLPVGYRAELVDHQIIAAPGDRPGLISCAAIRICAAR